MLGADPTMTSRERTLLERAVRRSITDSPAVVRLAQLLRRRGEEEAAYALLSKSERAICDDDVTSIGSKTHALAEIRAARMALGGYRFHEATSREWLCWPMQPRPATCWSHRAERGWLWSVERVASDGRVLLLQSKRSGTTGGSALHCFALETGELEWRIEDSMSLQDVRFTPNGLVAWWVKDRGRLTIIDRHTGDITATIETPPESWRQPLIDLPGGRFGVVKGQRTGDPSLGAVDLTQRSIEWSPLHDASAAAFLCAYVPQHKALDFNGRAISQRLGVRTELLGVWRDTHEGEHLVYAWTLQPGPQQSFKLLNLLWRVRGQHITPLKLPEGWQHEPALPRFFRVADRWIATLELHQMRIDHHSHGHTITPLGPLTQAAPVTWQLRDDEAHVTALPQGHAGAAEALLAGGIWWQLRGAPARLVAYLTRGRSIGKTLTKIPLSDFSPDTGETRRGWSRPAPRAAQLLVPLGGHTLVVLPAQITCLSTGSPLGD